MGTSWIKVEKAKIERAEKKLKNFPPKSIISKKERRKNVPSCSTENANDFQKTTFLMFRKL